MSRSVRIRGGRKMAVYQSGLLSDMDRRWRSRRALSGRGLTSSEVTGFMEPILGYDYQKSLAAEERAQNLAITNRQLSLQEKAARDASSAARMAGISDTGVGATNLYMGKQYLDLMDKKIAMDAAGKAGAGGAGLTGGSSLAAPGALAAPTASAPMLATPTTFGGAAGGGGGLTGGAAGAPVLATQTTFAPSMLASEGATAAPVAAAGPGLATTAGAGLVGAGLGYGTAKLLGANEDITQAMTWGGAGIGIGFMVAGPVGAVVGGVIGGIISLFDDLF